MFSHLHAFWNDLWPNTVAPSIWAILAIIVSHVRAARQRERHHEELKQHVTAATGGPDGEGTRLRAR